MSTSAFSTNDEVITRTINCNAVKTPQNTLVDVYEIERSVAWIQHSNFSMIALQFPDSLLVDAPSVAKEIQNHLPKVSVFILGDTSYGSCCVDEVGAQHYKADCVIHFGSACLSPTTRLPVLYVFGRASIDINDCVSKVQEAVEQDARVVLVYNTTYSYAADDVYSKLKAHFKDFVLSKLLDPSTSVSTGGTQPAPNHADAILNSQNQDNATLCKCGRRISLALNTNIQDYSFLFIGASDCPTLVNMMMTFNKNVFFTYDPSKASCVKESVNINRALMKRYYLVERAKDANIVGIVAGTLGVAKYKDIIDHLKALLKSAGKKSYTFVVGKLNPAKLANFAEVDLYVLVACPESCLLDQAEFYRPVVSPLEIEMACNSARDWTGEYSTDFRDLLPGGSMYIKSTPFNESEATDVSLINNKIRTLGVMNGPDVGDAAQQTVAIRSNLTMAVNTAQNAGEFFAGRSWQGLERKLGETPVVMATEGQVGIAASYNNEPGS
ncbi:2-(3-amino-3-carboxypropyl)histidine synthase subunit 2 [Elysia marginata]|uniref:2-(3-amino-3-carboxypropyl)histidine synthase subunit 2 n=1 Tax=Elysia marginata TaxID=1093978 RepID=A0AAV4H7A8_9GAST|nr:2-(3-amino-3-carboxypropyl)histidine synthase subunit 2 [Elysia marginata]